MITITKIQVGKLTMTPSQTAGVPLEEIDAIFGKKVAVRLEEVQGTIEVIGTGESEKRYDEPKKE